MDIRIKATDYELTPQVEEYLAQRIDALRKFVGDKADVTRCEVELGRDAGRQRHGDNLYFAEIRIISPGEASVYARNNSESVNGAIDDVKEEVERQLRKSKRVNMSFMRKGGALAKRLMWWGRG
ncbi:MAG: ribosome-associated translation inhibitor RaiA [Patescibacteria group bacterium]|nr:ribosome-associated translation inhibitor RaiA [Patescibacteria group bacterium]